MRAREAGKLPQALAGAPDTLGRPAMTVVRAVSVRHSHPEWVVARWLPRLGPEKLEALLIANNRSAGTLALWYEADDHDAACMKD